VSSRADPPQGARREPPAASVPAVWWAVLALVPGLLGLALWLDPGRGASDLSRAQLEIARLGLPVLAAGVFLVWCLRRTITADLRAVATRWRTAPERIAAGELVAPGPPRPAAVALWLALAAWAVAVALGLARGAAWLEWATRENGLLETATVLAYLAGVVLALRAWRGSLRRRRSLRALALLGLAGACFLIAAEETDWGQTYLRYETPDAFRDANIQQDFSLHNLAPPSAVPGTRWANWLLTILAALGGGALPVLLVSAAPFRRAAWALDVPLPPWWTQAVFLLAAFVPEVPGVWDRENVGSELREFSIAMGALAWLAAVAFAAPRPADEEPAAQRATGSGSAFPDARRPG